jgi:5'-nucleotidase
VLVLLGNDDGIEAAGLRALESAVAGLGETWVVAPATEQSARSHAFTMHEPLRVRAHGQRRFAVTGTPADAIYLALHRLLPRPPALVVSGINRGANLATDVLYSGTVAAAREAVTYDVPAIAASLYIKEGDAVLHWETAGAVVRRVAEAVVAHGLPPGVLLNVNVPNVEPSALRGTRVVPMGRRRYVPKVQEQRDPRGRSYYWIGGPHERFEGDDGSDGPTCESGHAVVTPLHLDLTDRETLERVRGWEIA